MVPVPQSSFCSSFRNSHHKCTKPVPGIQWGKSTNLPVQEKLIVGILQANVQATSNKTISSRQRHELGETEERAQQNRKKHRRFSGYYKDLVKTHGRLRAQCTVKEYQHNVLTAQRSLFCAYHVSRKNIKKFNAETCTRIYFHQN
jgi:hypothetical protein